MTLSQGSAKNSIIYIYIYINVFQAKIYQERPGFVIWMIVNTTANLADERCNPDTDEQHVGVDLLDDVRLAVDLPGVDLVEERHEDEDVWRSSWNAGTGAVCSPGTARCRCWPTFRLERNEEVNMN